MKMVHSMQGIYSPLPQSLSDSDSEKEISMEPICTSYNSKNTNNFESRYRQNGHSIHLDDDIVKIKRGASKMSTARKAAFVSSIILCFLPIIIFLWVLPCSELHTCPVKITNWEYQQDDIELKGDISLVSGLYKSNFNLALLYKGSFNNQKSLKNGVISFMGLTGTVAWDFQQEVEPFKMNCSIIDADKNGDYDCLVIDAKGLKAIETVSGQALWHAHSSEEKKTVRNLGLPVAIPDLNNDGVQELLSVFEKVSFLVISGKSGRVLANIQVPYCPQIIELKMTEKERERVAYSCDNGTDFQENFEVKFTEIEKSFVNPQYVFKPRKIRKRFGDNDKKIIKYSDTINDSINFYIAGNRKLTVQNGPNCPKCHCVITLYDNKNGILKTWSYNNAFVMNPKQFSFKSSKTSQAQLKGHLNGFIIKIWQWSEHYRKVRPLQKVNKRSIVYTNQNDTYFSTEVSERVVLITFNDTDIHVINASFTEINQICFKDEDNCQPSFDNQKDSLLVADLDRDGSMELVSFYSSYVMRDEDWHLVSFLKVLRLEEELPKLYVTKGRKVYHFLWRMKFNTQALRGHEVNDSSFRNYT